jgi:hypothetical protein
MHFNAAFEFGKLPAGFADCDRACPEGSCMAAIDGRCLKSRRRRITRLCGVAAALSIGGMYASGRPAIQSCGLWAFTRAPGTITAAWRFWPEYLLTPTAVAGTILAFLFGALLFDRAARFRGIGSGAAAALLFVLLMAVPIIARWGWLQWEMRTLPLPPNAVAPTYDAGLVADVDGPRYVISCTSALPIVETCKFFESAMRADGWEAPGKPRWDMRMLPWGTSVAAGRLSKSKRSLTYSLMDECLGSNCERLVTRIAITASAEGPQLVVVP